MRVGGDRFASDRRRFVSQTAASPRIEGIELYVFQTHEDEGGLYCGEP